MRLTWHGLGCTAALAGVAATSCSGDEARPTTERTSSRIVMADRGNCLVELSKVDIDDGTGNTALELIVTLSGTAPNWNACGIDSIQYLDGCQPRGGVSLPGTPAQAESAGRLRVPLGAWAGYDGIATSGTAQFRASFDGSCTADVTLQAEGPGEVNVLNCLGGGTALEVVAIGDPAACESSGSGGSSSGGAGGVGGSGGTGGVPTGGVPTGGVPTGGVPTGGVPTGGVPTGGAAGVAGMAGAAGSAGLAGAGGVPPLVGGTAGAAGSAGAAGTAGTPAAGGLPPVGGTGGAMTGGAPPAGGTAGSGPGGAGGISAGGALSGGNGGDGASSSGGISTGGIQTSGSGGQTTTGGVATGGSSTTGGAVATGGTGVPATGGTVPRTVELPSIVDEGGCNCATPRRSSTPARSLVAWALLAIAALRRRRRC